MPSNLVTVQLCTHWFDPIPPFPEHRHNAFGHRCHGHGVRVLLYPCPVLPHFEHVLFLFGVHVLNSWVHLRARVFVVLPLVLSGITVISLISAGFSPILPRPLSLASPLLTLFSARCPAVVFIASLYSRRTKVGASLRSSMTTPKAYTKLGVKLDLPLAFANGRIGCLFFGTK